MVRDFTLHVTAGKTIGFIGPNGAGKTTIKLLMGMLRPNAGSARVLGIDVARDPLAVKQRVGYVPEQHTIYRTMRAGDVIAFSLHLYATWNDGYGSELVRLFGLELDKKVNQLSKGMLAKLSLVLALAHEPEALILDEPMSGLNPLAREEFLDGVLRHLCDRQRAVVFSSHALGDVQRMADLIALIDEGTLLAYAPADELLKTTKRIRAVRRDGCQPGTPPDGTIWQRVQQRE